MAVLVHDPEIEARLRAEREASEASQHDEVWDGVYVMAPLPNNEHQDLAAELWLVFRTVLKARGGGVAYNGLNVSDREEGWLQNYREPDVAVILPGNPAKDCGTHWCGGPDFLVEILSPNDPARDKRPFYAEIGVRELLVLARDPWGLELYRFDAGRLDLVGTSAPDRPDTLTSAVLPLTFRLVAGQNRPQIEISETDGAQAWVI
jgi:Uma2 family endonuclease